MNMKKIAQGIVLAGCIYGAGVGLQGCSNRMRENTLRSFYQTAAEVQTELKAGNQEIARRNYEDMWSNFNQTRRDERRDFMGQMSQEDADTFEDRANWNALHSPTNNLRAYLSNKK